MVMNMWNCKWLILGEIGNNVVISDSSAAIVVEGENTVEEDNKTSEGNDDSAETIDQTEEI